MEGANPDELDRAIKNCEPYIDYSISETEELVEIHYLYVPEHLCNRGIGTQLLAEIIADIRNFTHYPIELGALSFNHRNLNQDKLVEWYVDRGFEIIYIEEDVYRMRYKG